MKERKLVSEQQTCPGEMLLSYSRHGEAFSPRFRSDSLISTIKATYLDLVFMLDVSNGGG